MEQIITKSAEETQEFAKKFAERIKPGDIVALSGELGAGKTTFTQGFVQGLEITNRIISPTFVIIRMYRIKNQESRIKNLYHIDLYRIENEGGLEGLGLKEILEEKDAVKLIEWPERMGSLLPEKRWDIRIESLGESERKINIEKMTNS